MLTLQCVLYTYRGFGWCRNRVSVRWVDHTGTDLQKDHRYQVLTSSCRSNLTPKLESTGSNRRWTCEVTDGSQVKTSYSYTEPDVTPDDPQTTTPRRDDVGGDQDVDHNDKKTTGPVSKCM
ncbi:hypothetical protein GN956_G26553 [Arapaima gigas]